MNTLFLMRALVVTAVLTGVGRIAMADDDKKIDDATFVQKAAADGMAEVELGKSAQANGTAVAVKRFADRIVKDHTAANEELKAIAAALSRPIPDRLDDTHQKVVDKFKNLTGAGFDKEFMDVMVKDHQEAVELFTKASKEEGVQNTRLKEFAKKTLPTLEEHLKLAKEVRDGLKK